MFKMKRASATGGIVLFGVMGLLSCAKEEESVIVRHAVIIEEEEDAGCVVDPGGTPLAVAVVDASFETGYLLGLSVLNNLAEGDASNTKIDDSEMFVESADVRIEIPQDPSLIDGIADGDSSLVEFNQVVASNSFVSQEEMGVMINLPPATIRAVADAIAGSYGDDFGTRVTMTVSIVLHVIRAANTLPGGVGDVESREFTLPIEVCFGCLRFCEACLETNPQACDSTFVGNGLCGYAQDGPAEPSGCTSEE